MSLPLVTQLQLARPRGFSVEGERIAVILKAWNAKEYEAAKHFAHTPEGIHGGNAARVELITVRYEHRGQR